MRALIPGRLDRGDSSTRGVRLDLILGRDAPLRKHIKDDRSNENIIYEENY